MSCIMRLRTQRHFVHIQFILGSCPVQITLFLSLRIFFKIMPLFLYLRAKKQPIRHKPCMAIRVIKIFATDEFEIEVFRKTLKRITFVFSSQ